MTAEVKVKLAIVYVTVTDGAGDCRERSDATTWGLRTMQRHIPHDRAVTPVVGIVLLLALTVLLAGTIGAFVSGFSEEPAEAEQPAATFEFEEDISSGGSDSITVEHKNGSPILAENLYVKVDDATCSESGTAVGRYNIADDLAFPSNEMGTGKTVLVSATQVCSGGDLDLSAATVMVVWENSEGTSGTYQHWEA